MRKNRGYGASLKSVVAPCSPHKAHLAAIRLKYSLFPFLLCLANATFAQSDSADEQRQRDTIRYGTDAEIASLIQTLKNENLTYLDTELIEIANTSEAASILSALFAFFGDRENDAVSSRSLQVLENYQDESAALLNSAIEYAGKIGRDAELDSLRKILDNGQEKFANAVVRALGRAAGRSNKKAREESTDYLISYYENKNPSAETQYAIVNALGDAGAGEALEFLSKLVTDEGERLVLRSSALESLGKIASAEGFSEIQKEKALENITISLSSAETSVRAAAINALGAFEGKAAEDAVLAAFRDSYYKTRQSAAKAAGERKLVSAVPFLRFRAENDEVLAVKEESVRALGRIGTSEAIDALVALFENSKTPDSLKAVCAARLVEADAENYAPRIIMRAAELRGRTQQTQLYNGLLKALASAKSPELEAFAGNLLAGTEATDKLFALDMIKENRFVSFAGNVHNLTGDKNASIARRARDTLAALE